MGQRKRVFLSAEWLDLVMLNHEVDAKLLDAHVPAGTVLDSFEGRTYVSLVGFRFCRTKLFGYVPIPFHTDFDEVNLRFYVRRKEHDVRIAEVWFLLPRLFPNEQSHGSLDLRMERTMSACP